MSNPTGVLINGDYFDTDSHSFSTASNFIALTNGNFLNYKGSDRDELVAEVLSPSGVHIASHRVDLPYEGYNSIYGGIVGAAPLPDGGFVFSWYARGTGDNDNLHAIRKQNFDANLAPSSPVITVATGDSESDGPREISYVSQYYNEIAHLDDGGYLITWSQLNTRLVFDEVTQDYYREFYQLLKGKRYDVDGNQIGTDITLDDQRVSGNRNHLDINFDTQDNGNIIMSWTSENSDVLQNLYFKILSADGNPITPTLQIDAGENITHERHSDVAVLTDGSFVVTWVGHAENATSIRDVAIKARHYDANGTPLTDEFYVESRSDTRSPSYPDIVALPDGGFVIAWDSHINGGSGAIFTRRYDSDATPLSDDVDVGSGGNPKFISNNNDELLLFSSFGSSTYAIEYDFITFPNFGEGDDIMTTEHTNLATEALFIQGFGGEDVLVGALGDDFLDGGADNDTLNGGSGRDTLSGSKGFDELSGDRGDDMLFGGRGNDTLFGGGGNDTLSGDKGDDLLSGDAGADTLLGGDGQDTASYALSDAGVDVDLTRDTQIGGHAQGDTLESVEHLEGSAFDDTVVGSDDENTINGNDGNDTISGYAGRDTLSGNAGNDTLDGGTNNDTLFGGSGSDTLSGNKGFDELSGDRGDDMLFGGRGNDTLFGGGGNDTLSGDKGDDLLSGGAGADTLLGGDGQDTASYALSDAGVDVDLTRDTQIGGHAQGDTLESVEHLEGSAFDDTVGGSDANNIISGGSGNDAIFGNTGNDTLSGNAGDDTLDGGTNNDTLFGGSGSDTLSGSKGFDELSGDRGDDMLFGGRGNDTLFGGGGNDTLSGDKGDDTYVYQSGDDQDVIISFGQGNDTLDLSDFGFDGINQAMRNASSQGDDVLFNFGDGDTLLIEDTSVSEVRDSLVV